MINILKILHIASIYNIHILYNKIGGKNQAEFKVGMSILTKNSPELKL